MSHFTDACHSSWKTLNEATEQFFTLLSRDSGRFHGDRVIHKWDSWEPLNYSVWPWWKITLSQITELIICIWALHNSGTYGGVLLSKLEGSLSKPRGQTNDLQSNKYQLQLVNGCIGNEYWQIHYIEAVPCLIVMTDADWIDGAIADIHKMCPQMCYSVNVLAIDKRGALHCWMS